MSLRSLLKPLVVGTRCPTPLARLVPIGFAVTVSGAVGGAEPNRVAPATEGGSYIVRCVPEFLGASVESRLASTQGIRFGHVYRSAFSGFSAELSEAQIIRLRRDPRILSLHPDGIASICTSGARTVDAGGQLTARGQRIPTGISRCGATESATAKIDGRERAIPVNVAVIDTGIEASHPDLRVVGGWSALKGSWRVDANGHGTHVAGIIAAKDNRAGVVGVAPGARIWSVRVLKADGNGRWSDVIAGIDWVTARSRTIKVANLSLGGLLKDDSLLRLAIDRCVASGVTVVVAAGNFANDAGLFVPGRYSSVISVSAFADQNGRGGTSTGPFTVPGIGTEVDEGFFSLSNWGSAVDIIAPGVSIRSTYRGKRYASITGTSQASPHVAGAAALFIRRNPGASPAQVRQGLLSASLPFTPANDPDGVLEPQLYVAPL